MADVTKDGGTLRERHAVDLQNGEEGVWDRGLECGPVGLGDAMVMEGDFTDGEGQTDDLAATLCEGDGQSGRWRVRCGVRGDGGMDEMWMGVRDGRTGRSK